MTRKAGDGIAKLGDFGNLLTRLEAAEREIRSLKSRKYPVRTLEDLSNDLGLQEAGEFRSGNGVEPGSGFTGGRFGYPGFTYAGILAFLAGVENDIAQVLLSLGDGKIYAGAGAVVLDADGITIAPGEGPTNTISWIEADGDDVATIGSSATTLTQLNIRTNLSRDFSNGGGILLEAYGGTSAADAIIHIGKHILDGTAIWINKATNDVDTIIRGDADNNLIHADASTDRVGIGTATPAVKLDVVGAIAASGNVGVGGFLGLGSKTSATISGDDLTITSSLVEASAESGTTDNLDTIIGGVEGDIVCIVNAPGHSITVRHNTAGAGSVITLNNAADRVLSAARENIWLIKLGIAWREFNADH